MTDLVQPKRPRYDAMSRDELSLEAETRRYCGWSQGCDLQCVLCCQAEIATLRDRVAVLEDIERAARSLALFFPFPDHPREVAPSSPRDLRAEYTKRLVALLDALHAPPKAP